MSRGGGTVNIFLSVNAADPIANVAYRSFTPFGCTYDGGASVAVAELGTFSAGQLLNAIIPDRRVEIVVGSGAGMPATVKAYDVSATPRVVMTITPMSASLQGGVTVASGLSNNDDIDDIDYQDGIDDQDDMDLEDIDQDNELGDETSGDETPGDPPRKI